MSRDARATSELGGTNMMRTILAVGLLGAALSVGCANDKMPSDSVATASTMTAYHEVQGADGRLYVVSDPALIDDARKGKLGGEVVTKIGYGPNGQTVKFQASKDGIEKRLMAEFDRRHAN